MSKSEAEEWLESQKTVKGRRPKFIGSILTLPLSTGGKLVVWRRKDEIWGTFVTEDLAPLLDAIKDIDHSYGKELVEALAKVVGVVRIELYNQAGFGIGVLWDLEEA